MSMSSKYAMGFDAFLNEARKHQMEAEQAINEASNLIDQITARRREIEATLEAERHKLVDMLKAKKINPENFDDMAFNTQKELVKSIQVQLDEIIDEENAAIEKLAGAGSYDIQDEIEDEPIMRVRQANIPNSPKQELKDNVSI